MKKLSLPTTNIGHLIAKYQVFLAILVYTATLGYTSYQISLVLGTSPDQEYLAAEQEKTDDIRIKSDAKALKALRELRAAGNKQPAIETGKIDPFSF